MQNNEKRAGFFELYGITEEEEEIFKMLYRRRIIYRCIITGLAITVAVLLLTRLL